MFRSRKITPVNFYSLHEIPNTPATQRPSLSRRFRHLPSRSERYVPADEIHFENLLTTTDPGQIILSQLENKPKRLLAQTASKLKKKINEDNKRNNFDDHIKYILSQIKHKIEPLQREEIFNFKKMNNLKKLTMNNLNNKRSSKYVIAVAGAGYLQEDGTIILNDGNRINAEETLQLFRKNKIMMYKTGGKQSKYYLESNDFPSSIGILNNNYVKNIKKRILIIKRQIYLSQSNLNFYRKQKIPVPPSVLNEKLNQTNELIETLQGLENKIKNSTETNAIYQNRLKRYRSKQQENSKRIPIYSTHQLGRRTNLKTYGKTTEEGIYFGQEYMNDKDLLRKLKSKTIKTVKFDPMHVVVIRKKNKSPDNIPPTSLVYGSIGYKFYKGHHKNNRTRLHADIEKIGSLGEHEMQTLINEGMVFYSPLISANSKLKNIKPEEKDFKQIFGENFLKRKGLRLANMAKIRSYVINLKHHPLMKNRNKQNYKILLNQIDRNRKMWDLGGAAGVI